MKKTKKGPLSKEEKNTILSNKDKDLVKLAHNLGRTLSTIENFINSQKSESQEIKPKKPDSMNLFARNKERGVVVMTESASMNGDESKKKTSLPKRYESIIHKIKEE